MADRTYRGVPPEAGQSSGADHLRSGEPLLTWIDEGAVFAITTWGSSSCPPVASAMEATGERIDIRFTPSDQGVCTADIGPTTHEFSVPDQVTGRPAITVRLGNGDSEESYSWP